MRRILSLLAILLLATAGCASKSAGEQKEPVKIRMGWIGVGGEIEYVLQLKPEVLKNYGKAYTIEWFQFQGSGPQAQALAAGSLDAASMSTATIAQAAEKAKLDVVITGELHGERPGYGGVTYLVRDDDSISSIQDLKGKTCATNVYNASVDYVMQAAFIDNGLKPFDDVKIVEVPFGLMEEALRSGRIDCGAFPIMYHEKAMAEGGVRLLFRFSDITPSFNHTTKVFARSFAEQHPEVMQAFQEDFRLAAEWMHAHRDEQIKLTAEIMSLEPEFLDTFMLTEKDYYYPPDGMPDLAVFQENWDFMYEYGFVKAKLDVNDYIIEELLK